MSDKADAPIAVVFDCMIYAQAIISNRGPAWACFECVWAGQARLIWSDYVLSETRELPGKLPPKLKVTPERVEAFILAVAPYAQHVMDVPDVYANPFDRDDSHYVNLAVAAGASVITSRDGDLLRLMDLARPEARDFRARFPALEVLPPDELLKRLRPSAIE